MLRLRWTGFQQALGGLIAPPLKPALRVPRAIQIPSIFQARRIISTEDEEDIRVVENDKKRPDPKYEKERELREHERSRRPAPHDHDYHPRGGHHDRPRDYDHRRYDDHPRGGEYDRPSRDYEPRGYDHHPRGDYHDRPRDYDHRRWEEPPRRYRDEGYYGRHGGYERDWRHEEHYPRRHSEYPEYEGHRRGGYEPYDHPEDLARRGYGGHRRPHPYESERRHERSSEGSRRHEDHEDYGEIDEEGDYNKGWAHEQQGRRWEGDHQGRGRSQSESENDNHHQNRKSQKEESHGEKKHEGGQPEGVVSEKAAKGNKKH